jgi:hypothetical protein
MTCGVTHLNLGIMEIMLQQHQVSINMSFFVTSTIEEFKRKMNLDNNKQCATCGNQTYFILNHEASMLPDNQ